MKSKEPWEDLSLIWDDQRQIISHNLGGARQSYISLGNICLILPKSSKSCQVWFALKTLTIELGVLSKTAIPPRAGISLDEICTQVGGALKRLASFPGDPFIKMPYHYHAKFQCYRQLSLLHNLPTGVSYAKDRS